MSAREPAPQTLGEAQGRMLRIRVRCASEKRDGAKLIRDCIHNYELDVDTLLWTRGRNFPIERLSSRLKCPRCNSRQVKVEISHPVSGRLLTTVSPWNP